MTAKLMVIDNYDSFTYNLVQMFRNHLLDIDVVRSDRIELDEVESRKPDYILISPGPRDPAHAGISIPLIRRWHRHIPIFGICLGMQCMNEAFGGKTVRAPVPVHGKVSRIEHTGAGIFKNVPSPFSAARYHSLMTTPAEGSPLTITAKSTDGVIMGLSHPQYPLHGVQFHPESFMTEHGALLIENFLNITTRQKISRISGSLHSGSF
ncbi:MAG: aminodeoxychorismate/anthranilate synthase component II [Deltaproteobacteria bacterium]|nr:aminodeoxychorismate/anthranilate synthase component II [Deltaproteobacteria bacterium]